MIATESKQVLSFHRKRSPSLLRGRLKVCANIEYIGIFCVIETPGKLCMHSLTLPPSEEGGGPSLDDGGGRDKYAELTYLCKFVSAPF